LKNGDSILVWSLVNIYRDKMHKYMVTVTMLTKITFSQSSWASERYILLYTPKKM